MARSFGRRIGALTSVLCTFALLFSVQPAQAGPAPPTLQFSADCAMTGPNSNFVNVPIGTSVNGGLPVTMVTTVTTPNTPVTFPNGSVAVVNEMTSDANGATFNAIRIISGPGAGQIVGQVSCAAVFKNGAQATPLVGSTITVLCARGRMQQSASGNATVGIITVGNPANAMCDSRLVAGQDPVFTTVTANGVYSIAGAAYPLAVDVSPGSATPAVAERALAAPASSGGGTVLSRTELLIGGVFVLLVLAQVGIGGTMWRRRRTTGD